MSNRRRKILVALAVFSTFCILGTVAILIAGVGTFFFYYCNGPGWFDRAGAVSTAREWARLDPLPPSATHLDIEVKGSMFTREFVVTFQAPPREIKTWLQSSPGTRNALSAHPDPAGREIAIDPGGGAQWASLKISEDGTTVRIHTYWS